MEWENLWEETKKHQAETDFDFDNPITIMLPTLAHLFSPALKKKKRYNEEDYNVYLYKHLIYPPQANPPIDQNEPDEFTRPTDNPHIPFKKYCH